MAINPKEMIDMMIINEYIMWIVCVCVTSGLLNLLMISNYRYLDYLDKSLFIFSFKTNRLGFFFLPLSTGKIENRFEQKKKKTEYVCCKYFRKIQNINEMKKKWILLIIWLIDDSLHHEKKPVNVQRQKPVFIHLKIERLKKKPITWLSSMME